MAVASRQVEFAQQGNVTVGRVVDCVVDADTGLVAQRERVAVQVPTEYGGTATVVGERIRAVHVPHWIQDSGRFPALTAGGGGRSTNDDTDGDENPCMLCTCCCMLCFLPFTVNKICVGIFGFVLWIAIAILVGLTALGPVNCSELVPASGTTFALLGVIFFITLLCCCFAYVVDSKEDGAGIVRGCIYCYNFLAVLIFLALVITSSALVFTNPALSAITTGNCSLAATPVATVSFSYFLCLMFSFFWCCACCFLFIGRQENK